MQLTRRRTLAATGALLLAGCTSNTGESSQTDADVTVEYHLREFDTLVTPHSGDVYYESDAETRWVGAQVRVTNNTGEEISVSDMEFLPTVDGTTDGVGVHYQSSSGVLDPISPDVAVETWLFYATPPEGEVGGYAETEYAQHDYEFVENTDLEMVLEERE